MTQRVAPFEITHLSSGLKLTQNSSLLPKDIVCHYPKFAAAKDDAPLTQWEVKADVSMPAAFNKAFSHLSMVLEVTALYGFIRAKITSFYLLCRSCVVLIGL